MRILSLLGLVVISSTGLVAQKINRQIKQENVERTIRTLSADFMLGRSALQPEQIDRATTFIEGEFKAIGLTLWPGLKTYRQEFTQQRISPSVLNVVVNGRAVPSDQALLVTEKESIQISRGLAIRHIAYDSTQQNPSQYFFDQAFRFIGDTTSSLVIVDAHFQASFEELGGYVKQRFARGRKGTRVFVLGTPDVTQYSIRATQKIEPIKMSNVVGVLPGKSRADELVVFSGHYDHLGFQKKNDKNDSIANGADDDASGTTAVIELARYFQKQKNNERTLVFVAFTAEEIGGYGSRYFSEQTNPDKVVAMFNIEMIGKPSKWGQNFAFITGYERSNFGDILQKNLAQTPFQFKPDPYPEQDLFYRSDNATLARLGVPAHTISTDQIDIDPFYHTVEDELETLDVKNITATIRAIALSARTIINGTDTPTRIDKASVR